MRLFSDLIVVPKTMSAFRQHAEGQPRRGGGSKSEERCTDRPLEPRPTLREQPNTNNSVARGWNRDTSRRDEGSARTTPFTFRSKPTVDWGRNRGDQFNGSLTYSGRDREMAAATLSIPVRPIPPQLTLTGACQILTGPQTGIFSSLETALFHIYFNEP